jgi:hypothetical protein
MVDGLRGTHIMDHKAATWFDAERYFRKYAWRYYLDIFNADRFTWFIWEMKEDEHEPRTWTVHTLHRIEQFRYPDLTKDCTALAHRMRDFAAHHLKGGPVKRLESGGDLVPALEQSIAMGQSREGL